MLVTLIIHNNTVNLVHTHYNALLCLIPGFGSILQILSLNDLVVQKEKKIWFLDYEKKKKKKKIKYK